MARTVNYPKRAEKIKVMQVQARISRLILEKSK